MKYQDLTLLSPGLPHHCGPKQTSPLVNSFLSGIFLKHQARTQYNARLRTHTGFAKYASKSEALPFKFLFSFLYCSSFNFIQKIVQDILISFPSFLALIPAFGLPFFLQNNIIILTAVRTSYLLSLPHFFFCSDQTCNCL